MTIAVDADGIVLRINPEEPGNLLERLDSAIRSTEQRAMREGKHGVLVTRHADFSFSVTVSRDVPYGMTKEHQC